MKVKKSISAYYKVIKQLILISYSIIKTKICFSIFKKNLRFTDAKPLKLIHVNPNKIFLAQQLITNTESTLYNKIHFDKKGKMDKLKNIGKVVDGNWDLDVTDFEKGRVFRLLDNRFNNEKPWEECKVYKECLSLINMGKNISWREIASKEDLNNRLNKVDKLFNNILNNGYTTQRDRLSKNRPALLGELIAFLNVIDEVTVNIARNGDFIKTSSGNHRIAITKILKIKPIPVRVLIRHKKWQEIRNEIRKFRNSKNGLPEHLKPYITHPDIECIKPKYQLIK